MADVLKLYGDLFAGALALTWAIVALSSSSRFAAALGKLVDYRAAAAFAFAALTRWYASFVGVLALVFFVGACAHAPVGKSVTVLDATADGLSVALADVDTAEACKAADALDDIRDALELLRVLAPAIDAKIAEGKAAHR